MPENSSSVTESLKAGNRVVAFGIAAIVLILLAAALFLPLAQRIELTDVHSPFAGDARCAAPPGYSQSGPAPDPMPLP